MEDVDLVVNASIVVADIAVFVLRRVVVVKRGMSEVLSMVLVHLIQQQHHLRQQHV